MSIWSDMEERGIGDLIKKEDIHKASLLIKKIGNAEKLSSFYTSDGILFKLNHQQQRSLRWHKCDLVLDDERFASFSLAHAAASASHFRFPLADGSGQVNDL